MLTEPRVAGLARDHRLAGRPGLVLADLTDEVLVSSTTATELWGRFWHVDPRPDGRPVRIGSDRTRRGEHRGDAEERLEVVASGAATCITAASVRRCHRNPGGGVRPGGRPRALGGGAVLGARGPAPSVTRLGAAVDRLRLR